MWPQLKENCFHYRTTKREQFSRSRQISWTPWLHEMRGPVKCTQRVRRTMMRLPNEMWPRGSRRLQLSPNNHHCSWSTLAETCASGQRARWPLWWNWWCLTKTGPAFSFLHKRYYLTVSGHFLPPVAVIAAPAVGNCSLLVKMWPGELLHCFIA